VDHRSDLDVLVEMKASCSYWDLNPWPFSLYKLCVILILYLSKCLCTAVNIIFSCNLFMFWSRFSGLFRFVFNSETMMWWYLQDREFALRRACIYTRQSSTEKCTRTYACIHSCRIVQGLILLISHRFQQNILSRICLYMAYPCMSVISLTKNFV